MRTFNFPLVNNFDEGDVLLKDGINGTKTILAADAIPSNSDLIQPGTVNKYYTDSVANLIEDIKGTTQTVTFNPDGTVQKVQHINGSSVVLREDVFTYAPNLITEVRTLSTLETITFKYHTDTLQTEVI